MRALALAAALVLTLAAGACADEITVLCPRGVQAPLAVIAERFGADSGHRVRVAYGTAGATARRATEGEPVGVGIAVRASTPKPDVSTPEALKAALLAASSSLSETLRPKTRLFPEGLEALERTAAGEVGLSAARISEIVPLAGLALAGPLPPSLQARLAYAAALLAKAKSPGALATPGSRETLARGGVDAGE